MAAGDERKWTGEREIAANEYKYMETEIKREGKWTYSYGTTL